MNLYIGLLTVFGAIILLTAWLPMALREAPLSLPIISVGLGGLLFYPPALWELTPHPVQYPIATERLSELIVIISLMGAGLKLDRVLSFREWMPTWRLIGVAMPLTIAAVAFAAWGILGVSVAAALLLGAALAPTDPVLATDVQVGPPRAGEEDEARFTLTSEAGLNDGFAFPFVNLAMVLALAGGHLSAGGWRDWFLSRCSGRSWAASRSAGQPAGGWATSPSGCRTGPSSPRPATGSSRLAPPSSPTA
jgi:NhaP-type Na+/H+ or K+/H+ antiporter